MVIDWWWNGKNIFFATEKRNITLVFSEMYNVTIAAFKINGFKQSCAWLKSYVGHMIEMVFTTLTIKNHCNSSNWQLLRLYEFSARNDTKTIIIGMLMLPLFRPPAVCISWEYVSVCQRHHESERIDSEQQNIIKKVGREELWGKKKGISEPSV